MTAAASTSGRAPCSADPELFFPTGRGIHDQYNTNRAKKICHGCPLQVACLDAIMRYEAGQDKDLRYGIQGGLDPGERHDLARRTTRKAKAS